MFASAFRSLSVASLMIVALATGCDTGIPGNGVKKTETRTVAEFDKIQGTGIGNIKVSFGEQTELKVTTDENLLEYVKTEVVDGTLRLSTTENINTQLGLDFTVVIPQLTEATVSGVGDIDIDQIQGQSLKLKISGVGSIRGTGQVDDLEVKVSGVGNAKLQDLKAKTVDVKVSGTGGASVFASESVVANVSGVGNISVYGNPKEKKKSASGVGSVDFK